jgi:hypothetical protein
MALMFPAIAFPASRAPVIALAPVPSHGVTSQTAVTSRELEGTCAITVLGPGGHEISESGLDQDPCLGQRRSDVWGHVSAEVCDLSGPGDGLQPRLSGAYIVSPRRGISVTRARSRGRRSSRPTFSHPSYTASSARLRSRDPRWSSAPPAVSLGRARQSCSTSGRELCGFTPAPTLGMSAAASLRAGLCLVRGGTQPTRNAERRRSS